MQLGYAHGKRKYMLFFSEHYIYIYFRSHIISQDTGPVVNVGLLNATFSTIYVFCLVTFAYHSNKYHGLTSLYV